MFACSLQVSARITCLQAVIKTQGITWVENSILYKTLYWHLVVNSRGVPARCQTHYLPIGFLLMGNIWNTVKIMAMRDHRFLTWVPLPQWGFNKTLFKPVHGYKFQVGKTPPKPICMTKILQSTTGFSQRQALQDSTWAKWKILPGHFFNMAGGYAPPMVNCELNQPKKEGFWKGSLLFSEKSRHSLSEISSNLARMFWKSRNKTLKPAKSRRSNIFNVVTWHFLARIPWWSASNDLFPYHLFPQKKNSLPPGRRFRRVRLEQQMRRGVDSICHMR